MISVSAIIQIAILYFVIYAVLKGAKGSRFGQSLTGVGILAVLLVAFAYFVHFDVLTTIVKFLLLYFAVSTVVIFQPEIRRMLSAVGAFGYFERPKHNADGSATPELVAESVVEMSRGRMGALIAFERGISLRSYEDSGVAMDSRFSRELVRTIFTPPLPLHDGGMIIRDGRIAAAHCVFPVSNNPDLVTSGMRHRAAVGLSEETDALVVVVSEETGSVSVAHNGRLKPVGREGEDLHAAVLRWISRAMPQDARRRGLFAIAVEPIQNLLSRFTKGDAK
ncbi:MAG: diadenylate cyclase [Kiritimatiellae bacterium]|nr:diadenylate cyclase [Kiritimatiellia bacterium]